MSAGADLFRFSRGTTNWFKTNGGDEIVFNTEHYMPTAMKRSAVEEKNELSKANITVELPLSDDLVQDYLRGAPNQVLSLVIFRYDPAGTATAWKGRLVSYDVRNTTASFRFESIFTSLRRPGLRARYQYLCRHVVYGPGCDLDPEDFATAATATAITNNTLTVPLAATYPAGRFRGGMLAQPDGTRLFISAHVGDQITLTWPATNTRAVIASAGSAAIKLYPGCDLSDTTCNDVFGNILNNGGFKWIPRKNPFGGTSIV